MSRDSTIGTVYLLHFDPPLGHARHYIGWALDVHARVDAHLAGNGSRLVRAAVAAGSHVELVRTWENQNRAFEYRLKKERQSARHCPLCAEDRRRRARESMRRSRARKRVTLQCECCGVSSGYRRRRCGRCDRLVCWDCVAAVMRPCLCVACARDLGVSSTATP